MWVLCLVLWTECPDCWITKRYKGSTHTFILAMSTNMLTFRPSGCFDRCPLAHNVSILSTYYIKILMFRLQPDWFLGSDAYTKNQKTWLMPLSKVICSRAFNLSRMITRKCLNVVFWHNYHTTLFSVVLFKFSFTVIFQPPCCLLIQHPIIIFSLLLYPI